MTSSILRLPQTIKRTGLSRSSIYLGIKSGTFPSQIKLGQRSIGFLESEIDEWIKNRISHTRKNVEVA